MIHDPQKVWTVLSRHKHCIRNRKYCNLLFLNDPFLKPQKRYPPNKKMVFLINPNKKENQWRQAKKCIKEINHNKSRKVIQACTMVIMENQPY